MRQISFLKQRTNRCSLSSFRRIPASARGAVGMTGDVCFLDSFALRQWDDPNYSGTRISFPKQKFLDRIQRQIKEDSSVLVDGYASFCKHVFVENFVGAKLGAIKITEENRKLLRSGYTRRRPEELPVLTRWFSASDVDVPEAQALDVILYSRDQLVKEYEAMPVGKGDPCSLPDAPWGIISIKAQDEMHETPMAPITILRNSLGRQEGGSGVPLDREAYEKSVAFWEVHATVIDGEHPSGE